MSDPYEIPVAGYLPIRDNTVDGRRPVLDWFGELADEDGAEAEAADRAGTSSHASRLRNRRGGWRPAAVVEVDALQVAEEEINRLRGEGPSTGQGTLEPPDPHEIDESQFKVDIYTSGVMATGVVRVTHMQTGATATVGRHNSTMLNRAEAFGRVLQQVESMPPGGILTINEPMTDVEMDAFVERFLAGAHSPQRIQVVAAPGVDRFAGYVVAQIPRRVGEPCTYDRIISLHRIVADEHCDTARGLAGHHPWKVYGLVEAPELGNPRPKGVRWPGAR